MAAGVSPEEMIESYAPLTDEGIKAALAYAAELAREEDLIALRKASA